jgi:hypothetical protein
MDGTQSFEGHSRVWKLSIREVFGPRQGDADEQFRLIHNNQRYYLYRPCTVVRLAKARRLRRFVMLLGRQATWKVWTGKIKKRRWVNDKVHRRASALNVLCGAGSFGKTWSAYWERGIHFTKWRMNRYTYVFLYLSFIVFWETGGIVSAFYLIFARERVKSFLIG